MDTASGALQAYPSTLGLYHLTTQANGHTVSYTLRIPAGYDGHTALTCPWLETVRQPP